MRIEWFGTPNCSEDSLHRDDFPCVELPHKFHLHQVLLTTVYSVLLLVGLPLNFYVIWIVSTIIRSGRDILSRHLHFYILSLSIVDSLVIMCIPFIMSDVILLEYVLGGALCRFQFTAEVFHKVFSSFILMGLSWDRLSAIRHPMGRCSNWNMRVSKFFISGSLLLASSTAVPILLYTNVVSTTYGSDLMHPGMTMNVTVTKCYYSPPKWMEKPFPITTFLLGFVLPIIAITACYAFAMFLLRRHIQSQSVSSISFRKVSKSVAIVVAFYYTCWAPYWFIEVILNIFNPEQLPKINENIPLFIHCLPLINSAINPILYALLNRELRKTYHTATGESTARRESKFTGGYSAVGSGGKRSYLLDISRRASRASRASAASLVHLNYEQFPMSTK